MEGERIMFEKKEMVNVEDIFIDDELYPRTGEVWIVELGYADAMKKGAIFPPIVVAEFEGKIYLIDGKHRIGANKRNKIDDLEAEFIKVNSKEEIFLEAIKRNIKHGHALYAGDKEKIIKKLKIMKYTDEKISDILMIPENSIKNFRANNISNALTKQQIPTEKEEIDLMTRSISLAQTKRPQLIIGGMVGFIETRAFNNSYKKKYRKQLKIIYQKLKELFEK